MIGLVAALYLHRRISSPTPSSSTSSAPAINLIDLRGNALNPSRYTGQVVLINFWAAWCTPCRAEIPQFMTLQDQYRSRWFQAVGISLDDIGRDGFIRAKHEGATDFPTLEQEITALLQSGQ
ncbi:MAG: TlpA family protein disulfide reductase [Terriglobales bacterium]